MEVVPVFLRDPYNYDRDAASKESAVSCEGDEVFTVQSEKDNADINVIVARFGVTGQLPQSVRLPTFEDYSEVMDFQTAMNAVLSAEQSFADLPPDTRAFFHNDPQLFLEFCTDPNVDQEKLVELGLASQKVADAVAAKRAAGEGEPGPGEGLPPREDGKP